MRKTNNVVLGKIISSRDMDVGFLYFFQMLLALISGFQRFYTFILAAFSLGFYLEIYFQMGHSKIGRYETHSLHTPVEMLSGKSG